MAGDSSRQISYSIDKIDAAANQFWQYANHHRVLCFSGDMGAGKTTFIHALCTHLGVTDPVSSPTFALINEYDAPTPPHTIFHMDWYRLRDEEEAVSAGMEEALLQPDALCLVEWPEKALALLPPDSLWIRIKLLSPTERHLTITEFNP